MTTQETAPQGAEALEQQQAAEQYAQQLNELAARYADWYVPSSVDELREDHHVAMAATFHPARTGELWKAYGPQGQEVDAGAAKRVFEQTKLEHWENDPFSGAYDRAVEADGPDDLKEDRSFRLLWDSFKQSQPKDMPEDGKWARFKAVAERHGKLREQIFEYRKQAGVDGSEATLDNEADHAQQANQDWRHRGAARGAGHVRSSSSNSRRTGSGSKPQAAAPTAASTSVPAGRRRATREATAINPANFEPIADQPETTLAGENPTWNEDAVIKTRRHAGKDTTEIDPANFPEAEIQPMTKPAGTEHTINMDPRPKLPRRPKAGASAEADTDLEPIDGPDGDTSTIRPETRQESTALRIMNIIESLHDMPPSSVAELEEVRQSIKYARWYDEVEMRGQVVRKYTDDYIDEHGNKLSAELIKKFEAVTDPKNWTLDSDNLLEARKIILAGKPDNLGKLTRAALARFRERGENNDVMALRRAQDYYRNRILMNADVRKGDKLTGQQLQAVERQKLARSLFYELSDKERKLYPDQHHRVEIRGKKEDKYYALSPKEQAAILKEFGTDEASFRRFKTDLISKASRHHAAKDAEAAAIDAMRGVTNRARLDRRALRRGETPGAAPEQGYPKNVSERELLISGLKKTIAGRIVEGLPSDVLDGLRPVEQNIIKDLWEDAARLSDDEQASFDGHKRSPKTRATPAPNNKGYNRAPQTSDAAERTKQAARRQRLAQQASRVIIRMSARQAAALGVLDIATPVERSNQAPTEPMPAVTSSETATPKAPSNVQESTPQHTPAHQRHLVHRAVHRTGRAARRTSRAVAHGVYKAGISNHKP